MPHKILNILDELNISYTNFTHQPAFSCDDAKGIDVPWVRVKSLLIRNKNKSQFYMVVVGDNKQLDTNIIRTTFGETKISFSSEDNMVEKIGVKIGHVSPFALNNNEQNDIKVVFDSALKTKEIWFHPMRNDNTVVLNMTDVEKFLNHIGNEFFYVDL